MTAVFAFALFAGVAASACDSCPAHAKKDGAKKECATKCDKDAKKCDKEAKKCDKDAKKSDCAKKCDKK